MGIPGGWELVLIVGVVLLLFGGKKIPELAKGLGKGLTMNRAPIYRWLNKYHYGGWDALEAKAIPGRPPKLTPQLNPDEYAMES